MMSVKQVASKLKHVNVRGLAREIGVSPFILTKLKSGDPTISSKALEKVGKYLEEN